ncbi:lsm12, putative [Plasmodium sp. gorilla clade G3]|nr:lsm12, putative [Plasmodium sp. gorilla clade G3]
MVKKSFDPSLHFGNFLVIKTYDGNIYKGELFCYDIVSDLIVIKGDNKNGTSNIYLLRISIILDVEIKPKVKNTNDNISIINKNIVQKIEKKAFMDFEKAKLRIGIGITEEAQDLFDFIWKTHPDCTWNNKDILVLNGEVRIKPPYGPNDCIAKNDKLKERFATVIYKFRQKQKQAQ